MKRIRRTPEEYGESSGTSRDPRGTLLGSPWTPLGPLGTPLGPPGDAPETPRNLWGPPRTTKNMYMSTNLQRQGLSIAASETIYCNA